MGALLSWMIDGCTHVHMSFPITRGGKDKKIKDESSPKTYVVCLDCGKEIAYNWNEMKLMRS